MWVSVLAYLLAAGITLAAADILYGAVERPCIAFGRRWSERFYAAHVPPTPFRAGLLSGRR